MVTLAVLHGYAALALRLVPWGRAYALGFERALVAPFQVMTSEVVIHVPDAVFLAIVLMVAGSVLTYTRAFQVGDRIQIGDSEGDVIEKTLLVTRIRTIKNVDISVPNGSVLARQIINCSSSAEQRGLILHTTVTIGYDVPYTAIRDGSSAAMPRAYLPADYQAPPFRLLRLGGGE